MRCGPISRRRKDAPKCFRFHLVIDLTDETRALLSRPATAPVRASELPSRTLATKLQKAVDASESHPYMALQRRTRPSSKVSVRFAPLLRRYNRCPEPKYRARKRVGSLTLSV